ncbi:MAG: hypothetical protein P4L40_17120 [Terracidiphilus sp.]|nr:hypothetical protein [Terracidiphilus sp.]
MSLKRSSVIVRAFGCVALAALVLVVSAAQVGQQATVAPAPPATSAAITQAANTRHQQLADDSARLLALAIALKAEVDKTNKDTLSLNVMRRADEIEKLAHTVREHMRTSAIAN